MDTENLKIKALKTVENLYGIYLPLTEWDHFERKFKSACKISNSKHCEVLLQNFVDNLLTNKQLDEIVDHLTIGETYFFREKAELNIFKDSILTPLVKSRMYNQKDLYLWSAGCCTGEEPFTLAMLLLETIPEIKKWHLKIIATDINTRFLEKAKLGKYKKWSLRTTPEWAISKYFKVENDYYIVNPEVTAMVEFRKLNLIDQQAFPSTILPEKRFDFIFCRNVLMYFSRQVVETIAIRFEKCLTENGLLFTSPVEVASLSLSNFQKINIGNQFFFKSSVSNVNPEFEPEKKATPVLTLPKVEPTKHEISETGTFEGNIRLVSSEDDAAFVRILKEASEQFNKGNYTESIRLLEIILTSMDHHTEAQVLLVNAYVNLGLTQKAKETCRMLLAKNNHARLFYILATLEEESGNLMEAESLLRQAIYIDHTYGLALYMMCNILYKQGNSMAADKYKENLLKLLTAFHPHVELQDFEGMTAGNLIEIITNNKLWNQ